MGSLLEFGELTREYAFVFLIVLSFLLVLLLLSIKFNGIPVWLHPGYIFDSINRNYATIHKYVFSPFGMACVVFYLLYELSVKLFINNYETISMPTYKFMFIFELCFLIFAASMLINAFREYHPVTWTGYFVFLFVAAVSILSYSRSPNVKTEVWVPENPIFDLHVSEGMIVLTLIMLYLLAAGYLRKDKMLSLGILTSAAAAIMTFFAVAHLIETMHGLTLYSYTSQIIFFIQLGFIFCLSYAYTFKVRTY